MWVTYQNYSEAVRELIEASDQVYLVEGPGDDEWSVMDFEDAEAGGFLDHWYR